VIALRRRLLALRGDQGVTIGELLVVVVVSMLIMTAVGAFFVSIGTSTTTANQRRNSTAQTANAMNAATALVRGGTALDTGGTKPIPSVIDAGPESLTFYAYDGTRTVADSRGVQVPAPNRVMLSVSGTGTSRSFKVTTWAGTDAAAAQTTRTFEGVVATTPTGGDPVFVFIDGSGNTLSPQPGTAGYDSSNNGSISAVRITLRISAALSNKVDPVVIVNTVALPNAGVQGEDSTS
jgi:Tfp pilus assembly protein PilW